jgi:hypothetical protein
MTILQRYKNRFDVIDQYGLLIGVCRSQREAQAFISAATKWKPAKPDVCEDEFFQKHDAYRPARRRS